MVVTASNACIPEDLEFQASLNYMARLCLTNNKLCPTEKQIWAWFIIVHSYILTRRMK